MPTDRPQDSDQSLADAVREYSAAATPENTAKARDCDWRAFCSWCSERGAVPLPASPDAVAAFLADQSKGREGRPPKAVATVVRYARTIHWKHRSAGHPSPTDTEVVGMVLRGIKARRGVKPEHQKSAMTVDMIRAALPDGDNLIEIRDRAILLFGIGTAMRESEIVSIEVGDLDWRTEGVIVQLRRSKTDQDGAGRFTALPRVDELSICPVVALRRWLDAAEISVGPVFRGLFRGGKVRPWALSAQEVAIIVKRAAARIGQDARAFGGHSLRIGFVTSARERGIDWTTIMEQTGHKTLAIAKSYSRHTPGIFEATRAADVFAKRK